MMVREGSFSYHRDPLCPAWGAIRPQVLYARLVLINKIVFYNLCIKSTDNSVHGRVCIQLITLLELLPDIHIHWSRDLRFLRFAEARRLLFVLPKGLHLFRKSEAVERVSRRNRYKLPPPYRVTYGRGGKRASGLKMPQ